ncbi:efflux RND transporter periplasmic adaptor subunit [Mangrovitalea sediminis]|uniref:efflux RND transporter periplasmic adaptor subunit n=1 Tax=Mangrovitalea sediminis TaxID=1982043 RepID=UPI000BE5F2A6|nr:efflux RND transporter periplasmic adaptor subunit [Mangrovitalea sediminis]
MKKKALITVALVAAIAVAVLSLDGPAASKPQAGKHPYQPEVTVAPVISRNIDDIAVFTGKLQAVNTIDLRPRVSGYVETAHFKEGSLVHKGDVLYQIDARPYQADVDRLNANLAQARAQLKLARENAARGQRLLARHALSKEEADSMTTAAATAQAQVDSTRAALESARLNLSFTQVRAPITGRISSALVTPGNLVTSSSILTRIVTVDPIYADFDVDEQHYLELARQQRQGHPLSQVEIGLADESGFPHKGRIDFVDNALQSRSGTMRMRAVLSNSEGLYTPGLYVRVRLHSGARRPRILIDDRAVGTDLSNRFVYAVNDQNAVVYKRVDIGPLYDGLRVIEKGLSPGDRIIINGLQRVQPGVHVQAVMSSMQANLSSHNRALLAASDTAGPTTLADASAQKAQH